MARLRQKETGANDKTASSALVPGLNKDDPGEDRLDHLANELCFKAQVRAETAVQRAARTHGP